MQRAGRHSREGGNCGSHAEARVDAIQHLTEVESCLEPLSPEPQAGHNCPPCPFVPWSSTSTVSLPTPSGCTTRPFATCSPIAAGRSDEAAYFDRYLGYDDYGLVREFVRDPACHASRRTTAARLVERRGGCSDDTWSQPTSCFRARRRRSSSSPARFPMGIASGALHHEIVAILRPSGLLERFPVIVAADDVAESKPAPETVSHRCGTPRHPARRPASRSRTRRPAWRRPGRPACARLG